MLNHHLLMSSEEILSAPRDLPFFREPIVRLASLAVKGWSRPWSTESCETTVATVAVFAGVWELYRELYPCTCTVHSGCACTTINREALWARSGTVFWLQGCWTAPQWPTLYAWLLPVGGECSHAYL